MLAQVSDHEWEQRKQARLTLLCKRLMATPVARGMFTMGTLRGGDGDGRGDDEGRAQGAGRWLAEVSTAIVASPTVHLLRDSCLPHAGTRDPTTEACGPNAADECDREP